MFDDTDNIPTTDDMIAVLRLSQMNASTRAATIKSVRALQEVIVPGGICTALEFEDAVRNVTPEIRAKIGARHTQVLSDCRRAIRMWNNPGLQSIALRLKHRLPTLEDASRAAEAAFTADKVRRVQNAITDLAANQSCAPRDLVATAVAIEPLLRAMTPEGFKVNTRKTLDNKKGYVRAALKLVDPDALAGRETSAGSLPSIWKDLVEKLEGATPDHAMAVRAIFKRLASKAASRGLDPTALDEPFMSEFVAAEIATKSSGHLEKLRSAARTWQSVTGKQGLTVPQIIVASNQRRLPSVLWETVPAGIREPVDALIRSSFSTAADQDWAGFILDEEDDLLGLSDITGEPSSAVLLREPGTMKNWRDAVKRVWHAANADDRIAPKPADMATLLQKDPVLAMVRAVRKSRQIRLEGQGKKWEVNEKGRYECSLVQTLISVATVLEIDEGAIQTLRDLSYKLDPSIVGKKTNADGTTSYVYEDRKIGPHHAAMLRQFNQENALGRWFDAPRTLWDEAEKWVYRGMKPTLTHASLARSALIAQISQRVSPMRRTNLCRLRIGGDRPHLALPIGNGEGSLSIPAGELKNLRSVTVKIDAETVKMIKRFIDVYRPVVMKQGKHEAGNEHLFPGSESHRKERGPDGVYPEGHGYQCKGKLTQLFKKHMKKHCMLEMDLQVVRHIAGKIILDMDPSAMGLVQELLGHKKIETTRSYYAEVSKIVAQQSYLGLLDRYTRRVLTNINWRVVIENGLG